MLLFVFALAVASTTMALLAQFFRIPLDDPQMSNLRGSPRLTHHVSSAPKRTAHRERRGGTQMIESLAHPSCLAERYIREKVLHGFTDRPNAKELQEYWSSYAKPGWNCFKHGGHFSPGFSRAAGTPRFVIHNAAYLNGEFFALPDEDNQTAAGDPASRRTLRFGGYFSMVSGDWPQAVTDTLEIRVGISRTALDQTALSAREIPIGYFQPPTDFLSTYHVVAETIFPAFHSLFLHRRHHTENADLSSLRESPGAVGGGGDIAAVTSRPVYSRYGFKPKSCREGPGCLQTVWGGMYQAMMVGGVLGLGADEPQFRYLQKASAAPSLARAGELLLFGQLIVGNPTHCEPLWGPDPFYAAALGGDHGDLRGSKRRIHDLFSDATPAAFRLNEFLPRYRECQQVLYAFRCFFLGNAAVGLSPGEAARVSVPVEYATEAVQIVFTTRKGDWARQLTNEDEIVAAIRSHLPVLASLAAKKQRNSRRAETEAKLLVVKFSGNLSEQIFRQLDVTRSTIFVGNHGANLLNSVYLRPNSGMVTLSMRNPGFWPFSVFPSWLHVRDLVIEHVCNRRLFKGKCKWGETHNNDMVATQEQIRSILQFLEEIVEAQVSAPRTAPA